MKINEDWNHPKPYQEMTSCLRLPVVRTPQQPAHNKMSTSIFKIQVDPMPKFIHEFQKDSFIKKLTSIATTDSALYKTRPRSAGYTIGTRVLSKISSSRMGTTDTCGNSVVGDDEDDIGAMKRGADCSHNHDEEGACRQRGCEGEGGVHCARLGSEEREINHRLVNAVEEERFGARIRRGRGREIAG
ncbi:hypothetical protein ACLOJK_013092 [Asimina triloba]